MAKNGELIAPTVGGLPLAKEHKSNGNASTGKVTASKRPDYRKIHALPLPLVIHSLPPLIPHNPLSLLHIAYVFLQQIIWQPLSIPSPKYVGYFSPETQSVHVIDPTSIKGLWSHGFFGKGSLSRSEPTWLEREKSRRGLLAAATSEENTRQRRAERQAMKLERARKEREAIEQTLKFESGATSSKPSNVLLAAEEIVQITHAPEMFNRTLTMNHNEVGIVFDPNQTLQENDDIILEEDIEDEEHLQLTLEEALFLSRVLGVLDIKDESTNSIIPFQNLLPLFMSYFKVPPAKVLPKALVLPDDPFLISYIAYHHFRSLGWVVKAGNKFSVDYLLYLRGPVFAHAEFAVVVLPSYNDQYWTGKGKEPQKTWHWFHMVNRVQSSVRKTLVFCYVDIPPPANDELFSNGDLDSLLQRYKVREFVLRRWSANRNRG
ncbi:MAG: hypothetical protein GOMPHAMPRED_006080 [Gomphillus americanus]|uniref:tRNA-splicing endonuclease subunit Sen2 n=1 Tax=Gomphillus americanus TaxID=1940652 RepID=A0A8H3IC49_9LECA|nr:MAG: hypothetical protein GOMPHAMPRED_006080 [Gomphillus americanus]